MRGRNLLPMMLPSLVGPTSCCYPYSSEFCIARPLVGHAQNMTIKLIPCVCDIRTRATYLRYLNSTFKNLPNSLAYSPSPVISSSSLDAA